MFLYRGVQSSPHQAAFPDTHMATPGLPIPPLDVILAQERNAQYVQAFIGSLLVVDYLQTLPAEIRYIWPSPWSTPKILFLLARYSAFLNAILVIAFRVTRQEEFSSEVCFALVGLAVVSVFLTLAFAEAILFVRVYALSGRSKVMLGYLIFQFTAVHTTQFALMGRLISNLRYPFIPGTTEHVGCFALPAPQNRNLIAGVYASFVLSGIVLVIINARLCYLKFSRDAQATSLVTHFMRDGALYFVAIANSAVLNVVISVKFFQTFSLVLCEAQSIIHVILACRLVLHLRIIGARGTIQLGSRKVLTGDGHTVNRTTIVDQIQFSPRTDIPLTEISTWNKSEAEP
ncbi:hypothetical protein FA15DRAFT_698371 [Coprinopsis marcescibilis]|uniref:DUF6533 domain-containing protein n=1 Tax=Coprinopsis marcescibilis TaxID=230819 RepID=A0A5C3KCH2_COPMA|nr:hypothetical protein FA15DRAFT_698371 [Coprinopsis marcescibilis]